MVNIDLTSFRIDLLRTLGTACIILAHVDPPKIIFQLRNFDVILLVLISGVTFALKYGDNLVGFLPYLKNRIMRLLVPSYIFLLIFFAYAYAAWHFWHIWLLSYNRSLIIRSFILCNSGNIGYVWIIAVFLIVAMIAPLVAHLNCAIKRNFVYFFIVYSMLILHEIVYLLLLKYVGTENPFTNNYLFFAIPYACIFAIGARLHKLSVNNIMLNAAVIITFFCLTAVALSINHGGFVWTQEYKYPPRLYYILYGLSASLCIYFFSPKLIRCPSAVKKILIFVSRSSLWIYLWHILLLYLRKSMFIRHFGLINNFAISWALIILLAAAITFLQKRFVSLFISERLFNSKIRNFLEIAFL